MKEEQERTPLRTILQNFLNHIESLEIQRIEDSYEKEFQELKFFSEILKTSKQYSCSEGEKEVNRKKNRYKDILPFDNSRVILSEYAGVPGSDYINANYIKGASGSPAYIACQGPLPHTVNDFWRMVVECEVQVIVMACNEEEAGKHKCENYWVEKEGEEKQFGMVAIRLVKASTVCPDFLVRTMRLKYTNSQSPHISEERTVCQFHYSAWPDHGVPPLVRPLLDMVRLVRDTQASETLPVLVHCSAGCGRTGTICAIDYVWGLLRAGKLSKDFSLYKLVQDMRKQRIAMVQTKEQYVLVHQAVRELFHEQLRMIDSHPYENIDANGMPLVKEDQEPMYASATVTVPVENSCEEKQDGKEKEIEVNIPPLPQKRRGHIASSKQEKEVENLTEKQRSIVEHSGASMPHKPRIAKLKALFERSPAIRESRSSQSKQRSYQLVARSHSLGAMRVKAENREEQAPIKPEVQREGCIKSPVLSHGILRISQISTAQSSALTVRPSLPVKRSKSLKVLGSNQRCKLSLAATVNPVMPLKTSDDVDHSEASAISLSSADISQSPRSESVSHAKPFVPPKKYVAARSREVNIKEPDNDSCRSSKQEVKKFVPHKPFSWMNYDSSDMVPRRRRSLESVNFEDAVPTGSGLECRDFVSRASQELHFLDEDARKVFQDCKDYLVGNLNDRTHDQVAKKPQTSETTDNLALEAQRKVNTIVAGLGVRERRNSFRQAVGTSREGEVKSGRKFRDYEAIWPSGSITVSVNGSDVPGKESLPSGSYVDDSMQSSPSTASNVMQQTKLKPSNWFETHQQNAREEAQSRLEERKPLSTSSGAMKNTSSQGSGLSREGKELEHSMNTYVKVDNSNVRLGKLGVQPKHIAASKMTPDWRGVHHNQVVTETAFIPKKSTTATFNLSSDINFSNSSPKCEVSVQGPNSAVLWPRKPKSSQNFRSVDPKTPQRQESGLYTVNDQHGTRTCPWFGKAVVPGKPVMKEVPYKCSPLTPCHRNVAESVLGHGSNSRICSASHSQYKSIPARTTCEPVARLANASNSNHTSAPFSQLKTNYGAQEVSYGLVAGVQLRRGSRDDLALCPSPSGGTGGGPTAPSRVRRHASVVLLRRSLAETARGVGQMNSNIAQPSLTIWNSPQQGNGEHSLNVHHHDLEGTESSCGSWMQAPGVDVDTVAASINPHHGFTSQQLPSQPAASVFKKQHYF
ncbi:uncharacterized protein [Periplaneta americana]|uniref:uncharacterized protein isoform X2 n=1 Tax=Periplaneta americana TaxID=6978 RepID=UPI0037E8BD36